MTTSPSPELIGGYELLAKLGEGGMGVVHLARRPGGERVALKMLRPAVVGDDEARARLAREVASLSRIRSRWVAEIIDADPWAPVPYVATRYVPGPSLHDHVVEEGPITGRDLLWFAGALAEGLASVHGCGVLHRDVKPSNVLLEGRTPILIDFGLARMAEDPRLTHTGLLLGTPGFLAPEILYGEDASEASDLHSWAASVAYAGLGRPPYGRGPAMAVMDRVRRGEHDLSGLPVPLASLLDAALAPEPADRPTLAEALAWLAPQTTRPDLPARSLADAVPQTVPLNAVRREAVEAPTDVLAGADPGGTRVLPGERWSEDGTLLDPEAWSTPPRPPVAERARAAVLLLALGAVVAAWTAAVPLLTGAAGLAAVWLLRSGSLAASAVEDRRRLRGRRWHDGPRLLLSAPFHLVRSIPSTLLLQLWALGVAASGALVCYAVAADLPVTLGVSGALFSVAAWAGPGGSRVRSPLRRAMAAPARRPGPWVGALGVAALLVVLALAVVGSGGVRWTPAGGRPLTGPYLGLPGAVAR